MKTGARKSTRVNLCTRPTFIVYGCLLLVSTPKNKSMKDAMKAPDPRTPKMAIFKNKHTISKKMLES